jgi:hypothetical protein
VIDFTRLVLLECILNQWIRSFSSSSRINTTRALARAIAANGAALSELDVAAGIAPLLSPPADVAVPVLLIDRAQLIAI